ncbi:hypothetical protein IFR05_002272 [Cadophora sp. M221]|nr:hypothetical protein IFR05_002272 [Cadophora sp. M221]
MEELHVFDPEGDVLLIFERYQEDDLEQPTPVLDWPEPELGPPEVALSLSADVPDSPGPEPEFVR